MKINMTETQIEGIINNVNQNKGLIKTDSENGVTNWVTEESVHESTAHEWPHIPKIQWEQVYWPISNTNIASFTFLILVLIFSIFANRALSKKDSRLKSIVISIVSFFDKTFFDGLNDKSFARAYFPILAGISFIVFFWNIFWLLIDWLWSSISPTILLYFRPINSDLNTTLVLAGITVVTFLWISLKYVWVWNTLKWYVFNFTWSSFPEKIINVFVWWLHFISIPSTIASLSLRLFGNIFAWVVLLWVISYLGAFMSESFFEVGRVLSIPFWFFELFVAFIQAMVFMGLMVSYFKQNKAHH